MVVFCLFVLKLLIVITKYSRKQISYSQAATNHAHPVAAVAPSLCYFKKATLVYVMVEAFVSISVNTSGFDRLPCTLGPVN